MKFKKLTLRSHRVVFEILTSVSAFSGKELGYVATDLFSKFAALGYECSYEGCREIVNRLSRLHPSCVVINTIRKTVFITTLGDTHLEELQEKFSSI